MPAIWTIYIYIQNVRFQGGILCPEKCQLDKIRNSRLAATIDFNMRNIWKTVPDSYRPFPFLKMCSFRDGYAIQKFQLDEIQNVRHAAVIDFNMRNIWKDVFKITNLK